MGHTASGGWERNLIHDWDYDVYEPAYEGVEQKHRQPFFKVPIISHAL